ncbi:MAG: hypothetical protein GC179_09110 [Anaerolineaceae bacterium]|nr:hypothetical protein [Anaerolineaceae bacterium]
MHSLKKRLIVCVALVLMFVATVLPVGAQDTSGSSEPTPNTSVVTLQVSKTGAIVVSLSLPVRCGNDC